MKKEISKQKMNGKNTTKLTSMNNHQPPQVTNTT